MHGSTTTISMIAEHQMVRSHIGVITNVRPDRLDEMDQLRMMWNIVVQYDSIGWCPYNAEDQKRI